MHACADLHVLHVGRTALLHDWSCCILFLLICFLTFCRSPAEAEANKMELKRPVTPIEVSMTPHLSDSSIYIFE